jgi:hypothetical protein
VVGAADVVAVADVAEVVDVADVVDVVKLQLIAAMTLKKHPAHLQQQQARSAW